MEKQLEPPPPTYASLFPSTSVDAAAGPGPVLYSVQAGNVQLPEGGITMTVQNLTSPPSQTVVQVESDQNAAVVETPERRLSDEATEQGGQETGSRQ